jgi:hypothetical protein
MKKVIRYNKQKYIETNYEAKDEDLIRLNTQGRYSEYNGVYLVQDGGIIVKENLFLKLGYNILRSEYKTLKKLQTFTP